MALEPHEEALQRGRCAFVFLCRRVTHFPRVESSFSMSKSIELPDDRVLDLVIEASMLLLVGIPIGSRVLVLILATCLVCLPLFLLMSPFLCLWHRRRRSEVSHPLSDWSLGLVPMSVFAEIRRPGEADQVAPDATGSDRPG